MTLYNTLVVRLALEAAEEADDAEGAEDADGEVEGAEHDEGHAHHRPVEERPGA